MTSKRLGKSATGAAEDNPLSRTPIYHQIFLLLRGKILEGEYLEGQYLPGERELCEIYGISRITAVRVLNELAAAGLVVREQGRGTRVKFIAQATVVRGPMATVTGEVRPNARAPSVEDWLDNLRRRPPTVATVHVFETAEAKGPVAEGLGLPEGSKVLTVTRVWRFEGKPYNHITTHVPFDLANGWTKEMLEQKPLSLLLEASGCRIARMEERVSAVLADMTLAERLEVSFGTPLLRVTRTVIDETERPVDYLIGYYPPERYDYAVSLTRSKPGQKANGRANLRPI